MAAVENATDDGTLDAFRSENDDDTDPDRDCDGFGDLPCWPYVKDVGELPNNRHST